MKSYYDILEIEPSCSAEDVKKSFRKKVKEYHPDLANEAPSDGGETLRHLLNAYQVLSDPARRQEYDRRFRVLSNPDEFDYRAFLKENKYDNLLQAKLIFFDLLHDRETDALDLYEELLLRPEFSLDRLMDREDFMDCAFLLAEEYEKRGLYLQSFDLLAKIVHFENKKPYFRHFFEEVVHRLRKLALQRLPSVLAPDELLARCFQLVEFNFSKKETAFYLKRIAEIYLSMNRGELAMDYLERGLSLDANLQGAKKLKERIGAFSRL